MSEKELFLDWLLTGVYHKAINEKNAHDYFQAKYGQIQKQEFLKKMYDVRNN